MAVVDTPPSAEVSTEAIRSQQISEAESMMTAEQVDLTAAVNATEGDINYFDPPPVQQLESPETYDWKSTGFWGGYDQLGGDDIKAAREVVAAKKRATKKKKSSEPESIDTHLGKKSNYPDQYDPSVLVREPRQRNRSTVGLDDDDLPFTGYDLWNVYEVSCLSYNGVPAVGVARVLYPSNSEFIVESKSLKLYFNSYNMSRFGNTSTETLDIVQKSAQTDLIQLLGADVRVEITPATSPFDPYTKHNNTIQHNTIFTTTDRRPDQSSKWLNLESHCTIKDIDVYQEAPELLESSPHTGNQTGFYHSALLKSNCKVTHQPDWGDAFIYIGGDTVPTPESLLKYIISFRDENHFHEEICETIYKRLWDKFHPKELGVACYYVRRGGIDINPIRVSHDYLLGHVQNRQTFNNKQNHLKLVRQ